jgi:hypothetical protein
MHAQDSAIQKEEAQADKGKIAAQETSDANQKTD